ncbi:MAG: hypothetical protein EBT07_03825 [Actinobacteria bacterium]|jgi:hypothetical protein|nr:hypothetical protein [Actinomycetota bacterium]
MQTLYLIVMTAIGGLLTLFAAAGWGSYSEKKLPAMPVLFRWFVTGTLGAGLGAYAWLYGAGGDPTKMLESMGEALEVKGVMEGLTSAVSSGGAASLVEQVAESASELTVGMPAF